MDTVIERPKESIRKVIKPLFKSNIFNVFVSIASNFKAVKRYSIDTTGYRMQLDSYWLLLLIGCVGRVSCSSLHFLYCHSINDIAMRNTQVRLKALVGCGLVIRYRSGNYQSYRLTVQAEKLLFSGIDKEDLLEVSRMVREVQEEEKRRSRKSKKRAKK